MTESGSPYQRDAYSRPGHIACWLCGALAVMLLAVSGAAAAEISISNRGLSPYELSVWRSKDFQKRMLESFLSETEIEPTVTQKEAETLREVFALMNEVEEEDGNGLEEAAALMRRNTKEASSAACDFTLANLYWKLGETDLAVTSYRAAIAKHAKYFQAWKNLGLLYAQAGRYAEAVAPLTKSLELGGGDPLIYGLLGYAYNDLGNSISAESAFRLAVVYDPNTFDWKYGLVASLAKQGRYVDVAAMCNVLIAEDPSNADLWEHQAKAYVGTNDLIKAAVNYEMIDELGGSTVERLNTLGDIYVNQRLFSMATEAYLRAIDMASRSAPDDTASNELPGRIIQAAQVLVANGQFADPNRLIERVQDRLADRMSDEQRTSLDKVAVRIAVARGSQADAISKLEEIVSRDPLDGEALILLGQNYAQAEEYEKAVFQFERAESLEDFKADALLSHAQLLVRQRKYAEALPLLRNAQRIDERSAVQDFLEQVERAAR